MAVAQRSRALKSALFPVALALAAFGAAAQVAYLDHEHMDFRFQYHPGETGTNQLNIVLGYDVSGVGSLIASNHAVYIVGNTNAKKTIPSNPDFAFLGSAGAPVWILPQTQDILRPYLGISAEDISGSDFDNPMRMELVSVEGPGNFFAYSVSGAGNPPNLKMVATNGVVSPDYNASATFIGSHEHNNWAFSTNGLYRVTFRCVGTPAGTGTNLVGRDVAFAFQLLPLRPWETWVSTNWPPATDSTLAGAGADPDADGIVNVMEYALGLDPNAVTTAGFPTASLVATNGETYGALSFTRVKTAADITYEVEARSNPVSGAWTPLSDITSIVDNGDAEVVTVRDTVPVSSASSRFYQLRVKLSYP